MKAVILTLFPLITAALFLYVMLRSKQPAKDYLLFVVYFYPLVFSPDSNYSVFQFITYVYFIYSLRNDIPLFSNSKIYITFYFLACVFFSALNSEFIGNSMIGIIKFLPIVIYLQILITECSKSPELIFRIVKGLRFTLVVSFAFLFLQLLLGVDFSLTLLDNPNISFEGVRYPGIFQDPQKHAQYLSAFSFIALIKEPGGKSLSKINYALFGGTVISLFLTGGRAALLGLVLGIFFIVLFSNAKIKFVGAIGIFLVAAVVISLSQYLIVFSRGESLEESYLIRNAIWQEAYKIFFKHPYLGIGIDNYAKYVEVHSPDQFWLVDGEKVFFDHPESGYLKFLIELGIFGFLGIFVFIFAGIIKGLKVFLFKVKDFNIIFLISALLSWFLGFYSVYSFTDTRITILIATILGLLYSYVAWYDNGMVIVNEKNN
jgi:O-antigen ligase